jgi:hypothetical protein
MICCSIGAISGMKQKIEIWQDFVEIKVLNNKKREVLLSIFPLTFFDIYGGGGETFLFITKNSKNRS